MKKGILIIMNKGVLIMLIMMVLSFSLAAQNQLKAFNLRELKVGDPIPDISLGTVINNNTGKTRFSDFKGKLVILDFWNTGCSYCIASFPNMSQLQKKFGDKIQIFLVNPWETNEEIITRMGKHKNYKNNPTLFPANLPSIVDAKEIKKLFPPKIGVPYHVWIDGEGIVRLRGMSMNTYEEKIQDLLSGKKISFVRDGGGDFDPTLSLYTVATKTAEPIVQYYTLMTRYSDQLGDSYRGGPAIINQVDSFAGTMRNAFFNAEVVGLYRMATNYIEKYKQKKEVLWDKRFGTLLLVKDYLRYTDHRAWRAVAQTDKTLRDCRFSYEQTTPLNWPDSIRKQYMLEDLNRFFGALYGAEGRVEKRKMPCWLLVRTSKLDKLQGHEGYTTGEITQAEARDKGQILYKNMEFKDLLKSFQNGLPLDSVFTVNDILIDETGYSGKVDMLFPGYGKIKSIEDFRKVLQGYDLDIIKGEREFEMLVIKENDYEGTP